MAAFFISGQLNRPMKYLATLWMQMVKGLIYGNQKQDTAMCPFLNLKLINKKI